MENTIDHEHISLSSVQSLPPLPHGQIQCTQLNAGMYVGTDCLTLKCCSNILLSWQLCHISFIAMNHNQFNSHEYGHCKK